jgi:hypothetical protein
MPWPATSAAFRVERTVSPRRTRPVVGRVDADAASSVLFGQALLLQPDYGSGLKEKLTSFSVWTPKFTDIPDGDASSQRFHTNRRTMPHIQALRHEIP